MEMIRFSIGVAGISTALQITKVTIELYKENKRENEEAKRRDEEAKREREEASRDRQREGDIFRERLQELRDLFEDRERRLEISLVDREQRQARPRREAAIDDAVNRLEDGINLYRDNKRQFANDPSRLLEEIKILQRDVGASLRTASSAMLRGHIPPEPFVFGHVELQFTLGSIPS